MSEKYYRSQRNALCLTDLKAAAIYFDRVVPINAIEIMNFQLPMISDAFSMDDYKRKVDSIIIDGLHDNKNVVSSLLSLADGTSDQSYRELAGRINDLTYCIQFSERIKSHSAFYNADYAMKMYHPVQQALTARALIENHRIDILNTTISELLKGFCQEFSLGTLINLFPSIPERNDSSSSEIEVMVSGMNLVDTSLVSWEKIIDLRRDKSSREKLVRMRIHLFDNYSGKSKDYVVDRLNVVYEEYKTTCKKYDLDTREAKISGIVNANSVMASAVGALVGHTLGVPLSVAAGMGLATLIGSTSISVNKTKRLKKQYIDEHPLSYVFSDVADLAARSK